MKTIITFIIITFCISTAIAQSNFGRPLSSHENQDSILQAKAKMKAVMSQEMKKANIQYFIIKAEENTYGYAIYINGDMAIQQTSMPSLPGNLGFKNTAIAEKIAQLVIKKIREGELPPTLSEEEVKSVVGVR